LSGSRRFNISYIESVPWSQFGQQQTYSTAQNGDPEVAVAVVSV